MEHIVCFAQGISDSLSIGTALRVLYLSKTVRRISLQCFFLNGVLFLGSIVVFDFFFKPLILYFAAGKNVFTLYDDVTNSLVYNTLLALCGFRPNVETNLLLEKTISGAAKPADSVAAAAARIEYSFLFLQYFLWLLPL